MTDTGNPPTLWSRDAPWVHVLPEEMDPVALVASVDRNDEFATLRSAGPLRITILYALAGNHVRSRMHSWNAGLDAERMRDTESLFREFVREFQFPKYFGWNLADDPSEIATFLRLMSDIGRTWGNSFALGVEWDGGEVPFNTAILGDPDSPTVQ